MQMKFPLIRPGGLQWTQTGLMD
uniref:Uncharacterized protein n=1 Tax=Phlebotomus papatasi TaxID=29031 RepID=A0A1B0D124_PHLPP